jgi:hypothetical protein
MIDRYTRLARIRQLSQAAHLQPKSKHWKDAIKAITTAAACTDDHDRARWEIIAIQFFELHFDSLRPPDRRYMNTSR